MTDRENKIDTERQDGAPVRDVYSFASALAAPALAVVVCALAGASLVGAGWPAGDSLEQNFAPNKEAILDTNASARSQAVKPLPSPLRSLIGNRQWFNAPAVRQEDLQGKVVLVNFWTYSCINSLRTLPYLRAWAAKYKDRGLVVIGVHTPEFAFERDLSKVGTELSGLPVNYPVVLDNDYGIWGAFDNNAWPGFYFVDAKGHVRHRVLGEGGYEDSERFIQKLLSEASGAQIADPIVEVRGKGAEAAPDWADLHSPETYVGFARASNFSSAGGAKRNASKLYEAASNLSLNHWSLTSDWTIREEFGVLNGASGKIAFRFHARDLHLVLGRGEANAPIRFRVTLDGKPPGADHGVDVDAEGWGSLDRDRMYQLVRQSGPVTDQTFEIEFLSPGARAYSFTFG
jgi:thiol-disulfide isomerase/thioredoxin